MEIVDITKECDDEQPHERAVWGCDVIAVHRIFFNDLDLATMIARYESESFDGRKSMTISIARRLVDDPKITATGHELAYTFLVDPVGTWWQCLPLSDTGRHARRWNQQAVGVGVIGDFRKSKPPDAQLHSLVDGVVDLCMALKIDPQGQVKGSEFTPCLAGHDELPGGSKDPDKKCPGRYLPMEILRSDVDDITAGNARARLLRDGLVL